MTLAGARDGARAPGSATYAVLPALGLLVVAAEYLFVRFRYGGEINGLNLIEAALAPLMFFYPPYVVVAVMAGAQVAGAFARRNDPVKGAFNVAQWTLATALGATVLSAIAGGEGLSVHSLFGLVAALMLVGLVNQTEFVVVLAIADREPLRRVLRSLAPVILPGWIIGWVVNTLIGTLFVLASWADPLALILFPVPLVVLHFAYRGYAGARADRMRLAGLHSAARALTEPMDPTLAIHPFLEEMLRAFDARAAELVLRAGGERVIHAFDMDAEQPYTVRVEAESTTSLEGLVLALAAPTRITRRSPDPHAQLLARSGRRDCLAAPLCEGAHVTGALLVLDQTGLEGFERGEVAVLEALARETATLLAKGHLLAEIVEERRRLDDIVGSTSDGIFTVDESGAITGWNAAMERITGLPASTVVGDASAIAAIDTRSADGERVRFDRWIDGAEQPTELRIVATDGGARRLSCSYSFAGGADGRARLLVVVARDITSLDEMLELRMRFDRLARERQVQRAVVEQLQEAVMPARPMVPGVELAVSYAPSDPRAPTGGDLYDWQQLPDGDIHVCVVDVLGHGVAATKDALSVVHAVRWLTVEGTPLDELIERASATLGTQYPDLVATVMVARFSPSTGRVRIAAGGHPPALFIAASGAVEQVPAPGGAIGWPGAGSQHVAERTLEPGDSLMIYTDGLVEGTKDILDGTETLMRLARELSGSAVESFTSEVVARALADADRRDDSLALVVRRAPSMQRQTWQIPPDRERAHAARREIGAWLAAHAVAKETVEEIQLIASELLSNAVEVARTTVSVRLGLEHDAIVVEVEDDGEGSLELEGMGRALPSIEADAGRGLFIVRALAEDVSVLSTFEGTVVRCTKALARTQPSRHKLDHS